MKAGREHRVPLSERAVAMLRQLTKTRTSDFVFPGQRKDRPLSDKTMLRMLSQMKTDTVTVHGFRSSFRDWAGNETIFPRDLDRDGAGPCRRRQGRAGLPAQRRAGETAPADGGVGRLLRARPTQQRRPAWKQGVQDVS